MVGPPAYYRLLGSGENVLGTHVRIWLFRIILKNNFPHKFPSTVTESIYILKHFSVDY